MQTTTETKYTKANEAFAPLFEVIDNRLSKSEKAIVDPVASALFHSIDEKKVNGDLMAVLAELVLELSEASRNMLAVPMNNLNNCVVDCVVCSKGDDKMSCSQIEQDLENLNKAESEINSKKGRVSSNVLAALFWWPGITCTYYDAGQALEAIRGRRAHLSELYNDKDC